ncbi:MAG: cupredoxin domain-containing protein [Rhodocyclaceae bacterium]|jgi:plastocyanin|nr:cupredoxin domain-containing protein [Rhodocyclaceae bacterium]MCL4757962.1 cupredoxin domain-containing protein [Rhodocyclaceae bacterium]
MHARSLATLVIAALLASMPFAGLQAGGTAEPVVIQIKDYRFIPDELTVKVGTTVRWENVEKRQFHSVYFESLGDPVRDDFFPGEVRERTFEKPGTYPYICEPHDSSHKMRGVIHVVE